MDPLRAARVAFVRERFRYFCSAECRQRYHPETTATPLPQPRMRRTPGALRSDDVRFIRRDDTELSVRLWQRGYTVRYVPTAVVYHHYEFSRNGLKQYLLERNRLILLLTVYQRRTLLVLAPMLLATETAILISATLGGWIRPKIRGYRWLWRNRAWVRGRRDRLQRERVVPDRELAGILTDRFDPGNVQVPRGAQLFDLVARPYWWVARRLL